MELDIHAVTKTFGLSQSESEVFEYLLQYGSIKAVELRKNLHLDRAPFYRTVNNLEDKNLIIVNGSLRNQIIDLREIGSISALLQQKKEEIEIAQNSLKSLQANMKELRDIRYHKDNVEIFSGPDAYQSALLSVIKGNGKILRALTPDINTAYHLAGGKSNYIKAIKTVKQARITKKIAIRVLYDTRAGLNDYVASNPDELKTVKYMSGHIGDNCYMDVCGTRTLFFTNDIKGAWAMIIKDELISKLMISIFDMIWENASSSKNFDVVAKR